MTVLIHEDFSTPLVSLHQWYRVGSRYETPGMTGLAHFFEHMMFKGTKRFSSEDFESLVQSNGGTNNAFTTYDYTGYYVDLPASKLELMLEIEADRMTNLEFNMQKINSEREVVKEERRYRYDNEVNGYLEEAVFANVFKVHPYRWPVIGYMKDLNAITMDQFKAFYHSHYAPNNSVLVIVGAVKTDNVEKLIKKYYEAIPLQKLNSPTIAQEPEQKSARAQSLSKDVQNPYLAVAYKAVPAGHPDQYAFDLLSNILTQGSASRLYKRLVYKEQISTSISSWAYTPQESGVFEFVTSVKAGVSTDRVLRAIVDEVAKLQKEAVADKELQKAKNQVMKSYVDSLQTISGKARALASNEILFGDYQRLFTDLDSYLAVTPEQIKEVATKYLQTSHQSVVKVLPKTN